MAEGKGKPELFRHLYNRDAPWTGLTNGSEFVNYLESTPEEEFNEEEKKCCKKLDKLKGDDKDSHPVEIDMSEMPWNLLKSTFGVMALFSGAYLPFPKTIRMAVEYVKQQIEAGKTIGEIAKFGKQMYERQTQEYMVETQQKYVSLGEAPSQKSVAKAAVKGVLGLDKTNANSVGLFDRMKAWTLVIQTKGDFGKISQQPTQSENDTKKEPGKTDEAIKPDEQNPDEQGLGG